MKCLDQEGLKYLWSLIEDTFATQDELSSKANAIISGLTTTIESKVAKTDIVNDLETADDYKVLSATMGNTLYDCIETIDANKPNYEEGTWTPKIALSYGGTQYAGVMSAGHYKRIGNEVHIRAALAFASALSSSNTFYLYGLPEALNPKAYAGSLLGASLVGKADVDGVSSSSISQGTGVLQIYLPSTKAATQISIDTIYWI